MYANVLFIAFISTKVLLKRVTEFFNFFAFYCSIQHAFYIDPLVHIDLIASAEE